MSEINRKSIFMTGLRNKVSYVFNQNDLKEVETIINFYENQLKQRDEVIDEAIETAKGNWSNCIYCEGIAEVLQKYKGDNNE